MTPSYVRLRKRKRKGVRKIENGEDKGKGSRGEEMREQRRVRGDRKER